MTCEMCVNYGFYEMVTSNKPYGYSGTIPCFTCKRYCNLSDRFVSKDEGGNKDMKEEGINMTTTLELSKQLYEKGLRLKTDFWWQIGKISGSVNLVYKNEVDTFNKYLHYPAYQNDELLAVMPIFIDEDEEYSLHIEKVVGGYIIRYENGNSETYSGVSGEEDYYFCNPIFSEVLGKMILYLLQNGYKYDTEKKSIVREE